MTSFYQQALLEVTLITSPTLKHCLDKEDITVRKAELVQRNDLWKRFICY